MAIAEEIPVATLVNEEPNTTNPFVNFQYIEAKAELVTENYNYENNIKNNQNIKIIKLKL
jgi:hypothetical protein